VPLLGQRGRLIELEYAAANPRVTRMPEGGLYWTAGMTAPVVNSDVPVTSPQSRGDMFTQSRNTLARLNDSLRQAGLTSTDVVFVRAFLGPDTDGRFDFDGWQKAFSEFFHSDKKPQSTTVTAPSFPGRGAVIEVEFIAAFPKQPALFTGPHPKLQAFGEPAAMISSGVAVKPGSALYFSGLAVPTTGGDMKTQALSALQSLRSRLVEKGADFKDVVFIRAYVPSADGRFDLAGWQDAYATFFNTREQPHKSARTTITVQAFASPSWQIAIDAVAVIP
jgi:enamine deaminase RidA (YjgF/YER057c/UK114 family)